ncbi:hypothetical protein [Fusobacterium canifelinum]|uniref:HrgC protein n=1 Tax=Fusobacterium canifelinum TaxID=285729 RepID=A0A3P1UMQ5_9FUSO|nr:hypothetical protein [Fusobacterium canifelinum]RRD22787.1 hypothetical protein EII27_09220 [Fusobacterium canifelinum]
MAIEINLEKYGHRKKGFLGFSWTSFFFNFLVPIIRGDFKWTLIFIFPYIFIYFGNFLNLDFDNEFIIIIFAIPIFITKFILPFIYNSSYTKDLLRRGYLPPEDDDYSNAILKGKKLLEYTNEDLLDKEKMERYRIIIEEYEKERQKDRNSILMFFALLALLIAFFLFITSY